jgi:hypothetical protein
VDTGSKWNGMMGSVDDGKGMTILGIMNQETVALGTMAPVNLGTRPGCKEVRAMMPALTPL